MFKEMNHAQRPSRDRFRLSSPLWNASPSKTTIWKSSCVKGTRRRTPKRKIKDKKSTVCLMSIKQQEDKTLRSYIAHFNKEALLIDEANDKILVVTFTNGL